MGVTCQYSKKTFVSRITLTLKRGRAMGALSDKTDILYSVYRTPKYKFNIL
jgi:hypothetical protein